MMAPSVDKLAADSAVERLLQNSTPTWRSELRSRFRCAASDGIVFMRAGSGRDRQARRYPALAGNGRSWRQSVLAAAKDSQNFFKRSLTAAMSALLDRSSTPASMDDSDTHPKVFDASCTAWWKLVFVSRETGTRRTGLEYSRSKSQQFMLASASRPALADAEACPTESS